MDARAVMHLSNWQFRTWQDGGKGASDLKWSGTPTRLARESTASVGTEHEPSAKQSVGAVKVCKIVSLCFSKQFDTFKHNLAAQRKILTSQKSALTHRFVAFEVSKQHI